MSQSIQELAEKLKNPQNLKPQQNNFSQKFEKESLDEWFASLVFNKLPLYQNITCDFERGKAILQELKELQFAVWQRPVAELWIKEGNWQYKKPKELTVQDFYPTEKQLEGFDRFMPLTEHIETVIKLRQSIADELERHYEHKAHMEQTNSINRRAEQIRDMNKQMVHLMLENSELNTQKTALHKEIYNLKEQIRRLKDGNS